MVVPILIPLINPNEPEALLSGLHVLAGDQVEVDDLICTLETTKSTTDVLAESPGYVAGLRFKEGDNVQAGDILCYLAETPDWQPPVEEVHAGDAETAVPAGLRITKPALALAKVHNLDLGQLPLDSLITEPVVQFMVEASVGVSALLPELGFDPAAIVIYGGGGHGKSVLDLLWALGTYRVLGFIDDGLRDDDVIMNLPVLGNKNILSGLYDAGVRQAVNAVGGIGNLGVRRDVFRSLIEAGFSSPAVAHPRATIEPSAVLSPGVQVFPQAYVGSEVEVGFGTIVNTGAIISHDCLLGELVNISPGAILAGAVEVGDRSLIGMGVTVNLGVKIGVGARVGNGATVKTDVPPNGVVQAGGIWPR